MSWLDALLGRIRSAGVDLVLGNGLNFTSPLGATRNSSTGFIDVTSDVNRGANLLSDPWTGSHRFMAALALGTEQQVTGSGSQNPTLGDTARLRFTHASGDVSVTTVSGCSEGRILVVEFSGTGLHTVAHDASTNGGFACPLDTDFSVTGRCGFIAVGRNSSGGFNWKIVATTA